MSKDARERVRIFMAAAAKGGKKRPSKPKSSKTKKTEVKKSKEKTNDFHDKLDGKLSGLAKKYDVSISLRRNKSKLPSIVVGRLRKKPYGEVVKLFNAISNTSPVPQKMKENGASFRVFGPRAISASSDDDFNNKVYMVVGKNKDGDVYWTDHGFIGGKGSKLEAALVDEETADKIVRRNKSNHKDVTDVKAVEYTGDNDNHKIVSSNTLLADAQSTLKTVEGLRKRIEDLRKRAAKQPNNKMLKTAIAQLEAEIARIKDGAKGLGDSNHKKAVMKADDEIDSGEDDDTSTEDEDSEDDEGGEDEDNIEDLINFITQNSIDRSSLNKVFDAAVASYSNDLKTNGPIDDAVGFIYDTFGLQEATARIKALANVQTLRNASDTSLDEATAV